MKTSDYIFSLLALGILALAALFIFLNQDFYPVPNVDVFQYIGDSRRYFSLRFPEVIHPQPLYPLLIGLVARILVFLPIPFVEIKAAILINSLATIGSMYAFWILAKRYTNTFFALLTVILLAIHPLTYYVGVNTTPEPVLTFFMALALLYFKENKFLSYISATLGFLVKFEALPLLITFALYDLYSQRETLKKLLKQPTRRKVRGIIQDNWGLTVAFVISLVWTVVSTVHNSFKSVQFGNYYFQEIADRSDKIPDWRFLLYLPKLLSHDLLLYSSTYRFELYLIVASLVLSAVLFFFFHQQKKLILAHAVLYCFSYLVIHVLFPGYSIRYFFPVLGFMYVFFVYSLFSIFKMLPSLRYQLAFCSGIALIVGAFSLDTFDHKFENLLNGDRYIYAENKPLGIWLDDYKSNQPLAVIAPETWVLPFYFENYGVKHPEITSLIPQKLDYVRPIETLVNRQGTVITLYQLDPTSSNCTTFSCLVKSYGLANSEILIVQTNTYKGYDPKQPEKTDQHCVQIANWFQFDEEVWNTSRWAAVYRFIPSETCPTTR